MANIRYISHASVLIESNNQTILTDPWYDKPAFGSWLPTPPMSIHPVYILTLAKDNPNFSLAISHGHDDHIDDYFLSLFDKNTRVLIPEYSSKGFLFRIKNKGFTNIVEVPTSGYSFNTVTVKSYINTEISRDDGILTFEFPNHFVVHANDNWQEITGSNFEQMKSDADRFAPDRKLFMSQCNLADGWPNIYRDYSEEEKNEASKRKEGSIAVGECKIIIESIGYEKHIIEDFSLNREYGIKRSLGTIKLIPKTIDLDAINVIEERSLYEF